MNQLTQHLVDGILNEDKQEIVALYAGGFKPPTGGHFQVVEEALNQYPEIDKLIVLVGGGVRDGIEQAESILVWEIYQNYLPMKVEIQPASKPPIGAVYSYAKNNPDDTIYWILGARDGNDEDTSDIVLRTAAIDKSEDKYNNVEVKIITTSNKGMSGTNARKALLANDQEAFYKFLPSQVKEKDEIFNILRPAVKETDNPDDGKAAPYGSGYKKLNEHSMGNSIDLESQIDRLTQHMIDKGYNIEPLPALELIDDDVENAGEFLGKTAYYNPNTQTIVLYTHGRHPKDIARSYAHEMIHHIQNLEGRLEGIATTNTQEDDYLNDIEAEANLKGTMTFRNWTDSLNENILTENKELDNLALYSPGEIRSMDIPKVGGIYFWWVNSEAAAVIDNLSPNTQMGMCQKRNINGEEYSLVYVGLAKNLSSRVKDWHIKQKHSDSAVRSGFISTLRHTIAAILGQNLYAQEAINNFQNKYMLVGFIETEDYKVEELKFIGSCSLPLNIRDNKVHPFYKELKALRKISKQNSLNEAIVGDKIECDNCGWSWKIVDGGDDLFICHKCDHDNTPLDEGFDKNLGKDPFGLNQFARELMTEGAYDALTTKLTKATINKWVEDSKKKPMPKKSFIDIDVDDVDGKGREIEFNYVGMIEFDKKVDGYEVDGTSNSGEDEGKMTFIATLFKVNPKVLPQAWSKISADVSDVIRHEIEHQTQAGDNTRSSKQMEDDIDIRDLINKAKILPQKNYYMLEKEIDAMLQGLYLKAKKTKKPFKDVISNYLDIAPGLEKKEDKELVLNLWRSRRGALSLPVFENKNEVMDYKIYLDMDGVLVDFDQQFKDLTGMAPRDFEAKHGSKGFWEAIETAGVGFWRGMKWMPGGEALYNRVAKYDHALLSSPSRSETSKIGKRLWRRDKTPSTKLILSRSYLKKNYASPLSILIDDRESNIKQWEDAGGIGILYISPNQVNKALEKLGL